MVARTYVRCPFPPTPRQVRAEAEAAAAAAKIAEERAGRERAEALVGQKDAALGVERSARAQAEQGEAAMPALCRWGAEFVSCSQPVWSVGLGHS